MAKVNDGAALISQIDLPSHEGQEFDSYADEHVSPRMRLPGFLGGSLATAVQGEPSHLVVYHLDSLQALEAPDYPDVDGSPRTRDMPNEEAGSRRFIGPKIGDTGLAEPGRYLYLVSFAVPEDEQPEFDNWYEREHLPIFLRCREWLRCRRYAVSSGKPSDVTRAALHELADLSALDSPERAEARATAWTARLAERAYFASARFAVYERVRDFIGTAQA
jgi:hypothetical protein